MSESDKLKEKLAPSEKSVGGNVKIVPGKLYGAPGVETFAQHGHGAVLFKRLDVPLIAQPVFARAASLTIVTRGEKRIASYDGHQFTIRENEAVFMPSDLYTISDLIPDSADTFEQFLFFFPEDIMQEFMQTRSMGLAARESPGVFRCAYGRTLRVYAENLRPLFASLEGRAHGLLRIKLLEALQLLENSDKTRTFAHWLMHA